MDRCSVAQVANLPYRRLLISEALGGQTASGLATHDTADTAVIRVRHGRCVGAVHRFETTLSRNCNLYFLAALVE